MSYDTYPTAYAPTSHPLTLETIPWAWVRATYNLQPSCLLLAALLWSLRRTAASADFTIGIRNLSVYSGLSRRTIQRNLDRLQSAGMIRVVPAAGRANCIMLNEYWRPAECAEDYVINMTR